MEYRNSSYISELIQVTVLMKKYHILFSLGIALMVVQGGISQNMTTFEKQALVKAQVAEIKQKQASQLNNRKPFVTGIHLFSASAPTTHPFFENKIWQEGKIIHEGQEYPVDAVKYDIFKDRIIHYTQFIDVAYSTALNPVFIKEFYIGDHHFKYYDDSISKISFLNKGYYEIVCDGIATCLVRHMKEEEISTSYRIEYKEYTKLILYYNGTYRRFFNQFTLLRLLKERRPELRAFIRENNIIFNHNKIESAKRIITYYNKLEGNR